MQASAQGHLRNVENSNNYMQRVEGEHAPWWSDQTFPLAIPPARGESLQVLVCGDGHDDKMRILDLGLAISRPPLGLIPTRSIIL